MQRVGSPPHDVLEALTEGGRQDLPRIGRAHGEDRAGVEDAALEVVHAAEALQLIGPEQVLREPREIQRAARVQALVLQVVDRQHGARRAERPLAQRRVEERGNQARRPVVAVDDVRDPAGGDAGIEAGPGEEMGAFARVLARRVDLAGAVVILVLDEPGLDLRGHGLRPDAAARLAGVAADADLQARQQHAHAFRAGDRAVERRDHADLMAERPHGLSEGRDGVAQPAGLGPGREFRGEVQDLHAGGVGRGARPSRLSAGTKAISTIRASPIATLPARSCTVPRPEKPGWPGATPCRSSSSDFDP